MRRRAAHVLVAGVSARAIAEAATRAGYRVTAIDAFGDADLCALPGARSVALPRDLGVRWSALAAARASRLFECDAVAYAGGMENHPAAVRLLAAGRALWGSSPAVLRRARDPLALAAALRARGIAAPRVLPAAPSAASRAARARWLVKPRASGGGHGIVPWRRGAPLPPRHVLQERVDGVPGSAVFVADGRRARVLGVTTQLSGDPAFGALGFRYAGSLLASTVTAARAAALVDAVVEELGLRGLGCVDFVALDREPVPIEVNPRWSASMELVERATGRHVFALHARACAGELPPVAPPAGAPVLGKAIVYAREPVAMPDTRAWLGDDSVRDVPHPGERIAAGSPICTVFAAGHDAADCHAALVARAEGVYRAVRPGARRPA